MRANQLRLYFSVVAYVLVSGLRRLGLKATELAQVATVTIASRHPIRFRSQRPLGLDVHYWARWSGLEALSPGRSDGARSIMVLDDGRYSAAFAAGRLDRRPMFDRLTPDGVVWADGTAEPVDAVILATGYRPGLDYLKRLGALDVRHQQAAWGCGGDPEIDRTLEHDVLGRLVPEGVEFWGTPQCQAYCLGNDHEWGHP
jgi:cation diffusion facilitator CzcD-associated flavoprotein CzcO